MRWRRTRTASLRRSAPAACGITGRIWLRARRPEQRGASFSPSAGCCGHGASVPGPDCLYAGGMPEFIYQMRAVRKSYGDKVVLDDVTLAFLPGAKIGVVGPNGTGKSSLLRMLAGEEHPTHGDARLLPGVTLGLPGQRTPPG